jgi:chaperonin GroEL
MIKDITKGHEARLKVKAGVDKACDAVRPTLGPIGMTAMIEWAGLDPIECDDGVTILKNLEFKDRHENMGLQLLRKSALRTSAEGGDGTATTTVLTQAIVHEAFKEIANDSSKIREVRERLHTGLADTIEALSTMKRDVKEEDIERIATISSLDPEVARLIAEVIKEVGINGVVTVEQGSKMGYNKEVVKGARFNRGLISPFFINDRATGACVLENPYIVLVDRKISSNEQIIPLLNSIGTGNSILIIADDVDSVALGTLAQNAMQGIAKIACVKNPYTATPGRDFLFDIASLTGATVISEEMGMKLPEADKTLCGRAEKVIVTRDNTTIIGGKNDPDTLATRIEEINTLMENTTSEYSRSQLEDRLAQLTGGIGVIRVGAYTDTEFNAKKYKFDNAINATQAGLQEGILTGGGTALAKVACTSKDPIFQKALSAPLKQMAENAGMDWHKVVSDVQAYPPIRVMFNGKDSYNINEDSTNMGCDFKEKKSVNMFEAGIIDPFKVVRLALESAVAIASSLISMETVITNTPEDGKKE